MFKLQIETDNASFDEINPQYEIRRIMNEVISKVVTGMFLINKDNPLHDINGKQVGFFRLDAEENTQEKV